MCTNSKTVILPSGEKAVLFIFVNLSLRVPGHYRNEILSFENEYSPYESSGRSSGCGGIE